MQAALMLPKREGFTNRQFETFVRCLIENLKKLPIERLKSGDGCYTMIPIGSVYTGAPSQVQEAYKAVTSKEDIKGIFPWHANMTLISFDELKSGQIHVYDLHHFITPQIYSAGKYPLEHFTNREFCSQDPQRISLSFENPKNDIYLPGVPNEIRCEKRAGENVYHYQSQYLYMAEADRDGVVHYQSNTSLVHEGDRLLGHLGPRGYFLGIGILPERVMEKYGIKIKIDSEMKKAVGEASREIPKDSAILK